MQGKLSSAGSGSGFVFSSGGYLFTNSQMVHGAEKLRITYADVRKYAATSVGEDPDSDLALLHNPAADYPAAEFGRAVNRPVGHCH